MYGFGLAKSLVVTLKNIALPSRFFTLHQYPNRKIGIFGLAKQSDTNVLINTLKNPVESVKALVGLVSVPDRQPQHPRVRGAEFTWYQERCTGCASCAKYCPLGIICIVTEPSGEAMQDGQKFGIKVFSIDIGRCMICGLCVEACPYDALHMGSGFEEARYRRSDLVIDIDRLRAAPKKPSNWFRPQLEAKGYNPFKGQVLDWREAGRHEKPSQTEQEVRWAKR